MTKLQDIPSFSGGSKSILNQNPRYQLCTASRHHFFLQSDLEAFKMPLYKLGRTKKTILSSLCLSTTTIAIAQNRRRKGRFEKPIMSAFLTLPGTGSRSSPCRVQDTQQIQWRFQQLASIFCRFIFLCSISLQYRFIFSRHLHGPRVHTRYGGFEVDHVPGRSMQSVPGETQRYQSISPLHRIQEENPKNDERPFPTALKTINLLPSR